MQCKYPKRDGTPCRCRGFVLGQEHIARAKGWPWPMCGTHVAAILKGRCPPPPTATKPTKRPAIRARGGTEARQ